jgi:hypothetical protein
MSGITAGLAVRPDQLTSTGESWARLVYLPSFPFNDSFWVNNAIWYSVLELDALTSYDYSSPSTTWSEVKINGVRIGLVTPSPEEYDHMSFHFPNGMLQTLGTYGRTGTNRLEIVPKGSDYLFVNHWRIHFQQYLP